MSKSYYAQFRPGVGLVYEEIKGVVTLDRRDQSTDPGYHVMPDIQPYKSMLNGKWVSSRSEHRALLKAHGCIEVGNETKYLTRQTPPATVPGLKQTLIDVFNSKT